MKKRWSFVRSSFDGLHPEMQPGSGSCFALALAATLIFYGQALLHGSLNAGFLYTGDFFGEYLPAMAKTHSLVGKGIFSAIDFSLHAGASEFFLRPNFFPYHPFLLIYSLIVPFEWETTERLIRVAVFMVALHSFLGCYFTLRLFTRFVNLGIGSAALIAVGFCFSGQMVNALTQPAFLFCTSVIPWSIYGALSVAEKPTLGRAVHAALPVLISLTGGYVTLGVASAAMAMLVAILLIFYVEGPAEEYRVRWQKVRFALAPFVLAGLVVAPLYWAIIEFNSRTPSSAPTSLFWSAHMLSEAPQALLRLLSYRLLYPGPQYEFSLSWGFVPLTIGVLFFCSIRGVTGLTGAEWRLLKLSMIGYFVIVLAIFGDYSPVSDLFYYFAPGVGRMHIYQRHLLAGHLFFVIAVALMFKLVIGSDDKRPIKIAMFVLMGLTAVSAHLVALHGTVAADLRLNNFLIFELLVASLFAASLLIPGNAFKYAVAIVLMTLPALDRVYDYSSGTTNQYPAQKAGKIVLDRDANQRLISYFRQNSQKSIIKYVDISPTAEYFPKNYPWFVLHEVPLSSFGGFGFYLVAIDSYLKRMFHTVPPGAKQVVLRPDWQWAEKAGADFVVYEEGSALTGIDPAMVADLSRPEKVLRFGTNLVAAPFKPSHSFTKYGQQTLFDNGYLRLVTPSLPPGSNLAQGKAAKQSTTAGGEAAKAVDGNTDGNFAAASVTHTGSQENAWWDLDLGATAAINYFRIWNRTDCCQSRLKDYWVFASDRPFADADTPERLTSRPNTWSNHQISPPDPNVMIATGRIQARYIRIQLGRPQEPSMNYLSLGEVEVLGTWDPGEAKAVQGVSEVAQAKVGRFETNGASALELDIELSAPALAQYLFWPNDRLNFYVNGDRVNAPVEDGLHTVALPKGRSTLQIHYVNWPLRVFILFYAIYALVFIFFALPLWLQMRVRNIFRRRRTDAAPSPLDG